MAENPDTGRELENGRDSSDSTDGSSDDDDDDYESSSIPFL